MKDTKDLIGRRAHTTLIQWQGFELTGVLIKNSAPDAILRQQGPLGQLGRRFQQLLQELQRAADQAHVRIRQLKNDFVRFWNNDRKQIFI